MSRLSAYLEEKAKDRELYVANLEVQAMPFLRSISGYLFPRLLLGTSTRDQEMNQSLIDTSVESSLKLWRSKPLGG
ncbi:TetR/AcrR family transcriptional regulator C-terminal domain-containing protein [Brucella anthropi]|uniref:TetR/AcrR family transcriptional regulator C-terminal domain-containing protein n=1 Tax=Brucella anthropi TaxID=529 RepID=UPI003CC7DCBA